MKEDHTHLFTYYKNKQTTDDLMHHDGDSLRTIRVPTRNDVRTGECSNRRDDF